MENDLKRSTIITIQQFRGRLDDNFLDDFVSTSEHGEWSVAFENQCDQLFEFDIIPNEQEFQSIQELGEKLKVDPKKLGMLSNHRL